MDISIVIAALNLLVNSFDKARALWREKKRREKITGAIHFLRIIQVLDRIVETGTKLISSYPLFLLPRKTPMLRAMPY